MTKIFYPYNEILPTGRAHDTYLVHNCRSLANQGLDVHLLAGQGSLDDTGMISHYRLGHMAGMTVRRLPILRRNNPLNLSWNFVFHGACQRLITDHQPDIVITSVRKQGNYHFTRKVPGTRYVFEVHELLWYPNQEAHPKKLSHEREMLGAADLVVVTTPALKKILQEAPYSLTNRIEVLPLAVNAMPLPPPEPKDRLVAAYSGQLYPKQGVDLLIDALAKTTDIDLQIVGGAKEDVERLRRHAKERKLDKRVTFLGFQPPAALPGLLRSADLFLMPSRNIEHKPYVAHTKLLEYANYGRPLIAPNSPVVDEHLTTRDGVLSYELGSSASLAEAIDKIKDPSLRAKLSSKMQDRNAPFTWERRAQAYADLLASL